MLQYTLVSTDDGSVISVFIPGRDPLVAHSTHPNFSEIMDAAIAKDESVVSLFDIALTAATHFEQLTERVSHKAGRLFFDGDEIHNSLATQVVRFIKEDVEDWIPLVNFFENVQQNPNEHSREQLFDWLDKRDFTITEDGMIVGYKSVRSDGNGGFVSISSGPAIVDGEEVNGAVPNNPGSVVEMPRTNVHHDPSQGCSTGLHVGTYEYAKDFSGDTLLEVHVNPRDVVSVPTDSDWAKMRVCRYVVVDTIEKPYSQPLLRDETEDDDFLYDDEEFCDRCGSFNCEVYDPNCDICHEDGDVEENEDQVIDVPSFFASFTNVDNAWRAWNEAYPNLSMTRDEFRAAVK